MTFKEATQKLSEHSPFYYSEKHSIELAVIIAPLNQRLFEIFLTQLIPCGEGIIQEYREVTASFKIIGVWTDGTNILYEDLSL